MDERYKMIGDERCQNCGKIYKLCWKAPDEIWNKIVGSYSGLLCIECFDSIAAANNISLSWECNNHPIFKNKE